MSTVLRILLPNGDELVELKLPAGCTFRFGDEDPRVARAPNRDVLINEIERIREEQKRDPVPYPRLPFGN